MENDSAGNLKDPSSATEVLGKYELGKLVGCGAFAKVYHARNVHTGQSVAIKVVSKRKVLKKGLGAHLKREVSIMRHVRHSHVIRLLEVLATKSKVYFVMEFAKGGELFAKVAKHGRLPEDLCRKYFRQLLSAVGYCHSRGVFHRDLKPENLLLDENSDLKITDFGLSAVKDQIRADGLLHTLCGTPAYVAPEILAKKGYDGAKVDVWSCGVVLYVMNTGYLPFNDHNLMAMYQKIYRGEYRCPKWTSPELRRFLSRVLDPNPETRITVDEIIRDPWFCRGGYKSDTVRFEDRFFFDIKGGGGGDRNSKKLLNAFDIISFSPGFDLSALLEETESDVSRERFATVESPERVIGKIKEIAKAAEGVTVAKEKGWGLKLQGQNGNVAVVICFYRLTEGLFVVETKKRNSGDKPGPDFWEDKVRPHLCGFIYEPDRLVPET